MLIVRFALYETPLFRSVPYGLFINPAPVFRRFCRRGILASFLVFFSFINYNNTTNQKGI